MLRLSSLDIDAALSDLCQLLVGIFFFLERLFKQTYSLLLAEPLGIGTECTIRRDLIMFDPLCRRNQSSVADFRLGTLIDHVLAFFDQTLHSFAFLRFCRAAYLLKHLLKPAYMIFGLGKVILEGRLKLH